MRSLVVAPHPDDETLGAGGTMLRRKTEDAQTAWLIVTSMSVAGGWSDEAVRRREAEIEHTRELLQFDEVFRLDLPPAELDRLPTRSIVDAISKVFGAFHPNEVLVPHSSDIHSDHKIVHEAVVSCTKWFRHPYVNRVLCYETLSETDFGLGYAGSFRPNYFVDIGAHLEGKLDALRVYASELGELPFPRSLEAVRALSVLRGAAAGYLAAEAFELLLQRS